MWFKMGKILKKIPFLNKQKSFIQPIIEKLTSKSENSELVKESYNVDFTKDIVNGVNKESYELDIMGDEQPRLLGYKSTPDLRGRIKPQKLEEAYMRDPHLFNGINLYTKLIMGAGYKLTCDNESVLSELETWARAVKLSSVLDEIVSHMLIYGNAYCEIAYNKDGKVVGLVPLNPKMIDYAKDMQQNILLDSRGKPYGYVQNIPFGAKKTGDRFPLPKGLSIGDDEIYFPSDHIAHFKLYTVGEGFYGIGLIEPVYNLSLIKFNVQEGFGEAAHRTGQPLIYAKVGDAENHEPTPQEMKDVSDRLLKLKANSVSAFPYYVDPEILESQRGLESLSDALDYFIESQAASLSIPIPLLTGSGADTNRAVLLIQYQLLERSMSLIQKRVSEGLEKPFNILSDLRGWNTKKSPIEIDWNEVSITDMNEKAKRMDKYVNSGLLTPDDEIEKLIRKIEDLPALSNDNKNINRQPKKEKPTDKQEPSD